MLKFVRGILATMIALAALVVVEQAFGMMTAIVATGIGFLAYVAWLTLRQMADEDDDDTA